MYSNENASGKEALASKLAELLSDLNVMATVSHGFHWNVKGADFKEYHAFFGDIYEMAQDGIDPVAENILKLGYDAPYLMQDFLSLTCIQASRIRSTDPESMTQQLLQVNAAVHASTKEAFDSAIAADVQSIANFLADRLDQHEKMQWQLAASLGLSVSEALGGPAVDAMGGDILPEDVVAEEPVLDDMADFRG